MKAEIRFPLLLGVAAIGLFSCGDSAETTSESSFLSSEAETSQIPSETSELTDTSSSEEPEPEYNWPSEEIASLLVSEIGYEGDIEIPAPSIALGAGRTYEIATGDYWLGTEDPIISIAASGDFTAYLDEVIDNDEWMEPDHEFEGYRFAHTLDLELQIVVYDYDEDTDTTDVFISLTQGIYGLWPEELIQERVENIAGEGASSLPIVDDIGLYADGTWSSYTFNFYLYSDVNEDAYGVLLSANGFKPFDYLGSTYYSAPDNGYVVYLNGDYHEDYGYLFIQVSEPSTVPLYTLERSSTFDTSVSTYLRLYAGSGLIASLPEASNLSYDFAYFAGDYYSKSIGLWFWKWNGTNLVDLSEAYAMLLGRSDWTYVSALGGYLDKATGTVKITLTGPSLDNLVSLYVYIEVGDYTQYL